MSNLNDDFKQRMNKVRESEMKHNSEKIKAGRRDYDKYTPTKYTEEGK